MGSNNRVDDEKDDKIGSSRFTNWLSRLEPRAAKIPDIGRYLNIFQTVLQLQLIYENYVENDSFTVIFSKNNLSY